MTLGQPRRKYEGCLGGVTKKEDNMKKLNIYKSKILLMAFLAVSTACTDLEQEIRDEILIDNISEVQDAAKKQLSATYAKSENIFANYNGIWCLQQITTDEAVLPARGEDWRDGGRWKQMHEFTWDNKNSKINGNWVNLNNAVAQAAVTINTINDFIKSDTGGEELPQYMAEAKGLWALYTYYIIDLFGQVPFRDPMQEMNFAEKPDMILTSSEAIQKCISFLEEAIPNLPTRANTHAGRFTKEAAYALLAEIYLNKAVYEDRYKAGEPNFSKADMDKVIEYTTHLIDGKEGFAFQLEKDYFEVFGVKNNNNPEHIFAIIQVATGDNPGQNDFTYLSMGRIQKANGKDNRGSNATCTTPDYFATWKENTTDPRFHKHTTKNGGVVFRNDGTDGSLPFDGIFHFNRGFQQGQQYGLILEKVDKIKKPILDPNDPSKVLVQKLYTEKNDKLPLDFTPELNFDNPADASLTPDQLNRGVRVFKYEYDAENTRKNGGVDIPVFRLGGIYTMRAEAKFRNGDVAGAKEDINILRTSRTSIDIDGNEYAGTPVNNFDKTTLYNEISYELYWEAKRRPQMIRFGTFENAYTAKPVSEPFRRIFPIPQNELDANNDYEQNQGY